MKDPTSNFQHPEKHQILSSNHRNNACSLFEIGSLVLHWCLVLGAWNLFAK
jgi:hypothetical protein